ncbi:hypothetical protein CJF31_00000470 [Rutstroemia sp. NJR-2017a BVV2]|nr:hypothetical protein CJF31_00000470 [Rutstroemia sp. NJR-2017a BVV2]
MPFTLNASASYDLSSNTSFGDSDWNRSGSYQTIKNKDGTTYTRRTQKNGGPIVEEIKRWDGMGRRILEDGSVYEKNGKGRGWKQVQGPTVKPVESGSKSGRKKRGTILGMTTDESKLGESGSKSGRKKRGTILGMTTDESKNVLDGSPGYGPNGWEKSKTFTKSSPKAATTSPTTKQKGKQGTKKKPKAAKIQESSDESETADDDDDTDGYEVEEVFSSEDEREKEKEDKPEWKKPAPALKQEAKQKPVQRGKNTKKSVAIP